MKTRGTLNFLKRAGAILMLLAIFASSCNKYADDFKQMNTKLDALITGKAELTTDLGLVKASVLSLQSAIGAIPNPTVSIAALGTQLTGLTTKLNDIQTSLNTLSDKVAAGKLTSDAAALVVAQLKIDLAAAQADITKLIANATFSVTEIAAITGIAQVGAKLTAGVLTPSFALVTYQWKSAATSDGTYADIAGATTNKYTLVTGDATKFIKVTATGTGSYTGTVTSAATTVVTAQATFTIGAITGTAQVGVQLTAGALEPAGATVTYQWQSAATAGGTYVDIAGATTSKCTPTTGDAGKFIKVVATGTGSYTGTGEAVTDAAVGYSAQLTGVVITGTQRVYAKLTATVSPAVTASSVAYKWYALPTATTVIDDNTVAIADAITNEYTLVAADAGKFIKVVATGTFLTGTTSVTSAATGKIAALILITAIGDITGTAQVGVQLTAGALTPADATVNYQWYLVAAADTNVADAYKIAGATTNKYTPVATDAGKFIKVVATGKVGYTGAVTSAATSAVVIQ